MSEIARQFLGAWRLVGSQQKLADGSVRNNPFYGPGGVGYLIYSDSGYMCVVTMDPSRPRWKNEAVPTEAELRSAMGGLMAYAGPYEVNAEGGYVIHHVAVDKIPNRVGAKQKRFFTFSGDQLILRPEPPLPAGVADYWLTWERIR
ncbi:MAG TPA: lipocalin-like domain-containing protein [Terriglobia bacterium]|nr:lipocalin-like domain-containing protein [Terriglobia bacterium]